MYFFLSHPSKYVKSTENIRVSAPSIIAYNPWCVCLCVCIYSTFSFSTLFSSFDVYLHFSVLVCVCASNEFPLMNFFSNFSLVCLYLLYAKLFSFFKHDFILLANFFLTVRIWLLTATRKIFKFE